jgi:hypothetical protein
VHAGRRASDPTGHLEPFFCASRLRATPGDGLPFLVALLRVCLDCGNPPSLVVDCRVGFDFGWGLGAIIWVPVLVPPGEFFLALLEAGEVAAAGDAAVRSGSEAQLQGGPARRAVMLFAPGGKLLAIAFRAARVFPRGGFPGASGPTVIAAAAAQRANTDQALEPLGHTRAMGHTGIAGAALRARQFHFPRPRVNYRLDWGEA